MKLLYFSVLTLMKVMLVFVLFMAFADEAECARLIGEEGSLISTDRSERDVITAEDILTKNYSETQDNLEGLVYKIDTDSSLLTIQEPSGSVPKRIFIQPETIFSGAASLKDLSLNDKVYVLYYRDLSGQMVARYVHLIARENEPNPYTLSGQMKENFISYLINSLTVPEEYTRAYAAYALGNFNDPTVVSELTYVLRHDAGSIVRINAAKSLAKLKDPSSVPDLVAALAAVDKIENYQITMALLEIGKPAIESLIEGLYATDKNIRRAAAWTLGEIEKGSMSGSSTYVSAAFEPLVSTLNDDSTLVRQAAEDALKAITDQNFGKKADAWRVWFNERQLE